MFKTMAIGVMYNKGDVVGNNGVVFLIELIRKEKYKRRALFLCTCGNTFEAIISNVTTGNTRSCGCFQKKRVIEASLKHGLRSHPLYSTWCNIKTRCFNKNCDCYDCYGGRGITVSSEFANNAGLFIKYVLSLDNSMRDGYSIDRINNNGNYERGNLRWADWFTQSVNKRNNHVTKSGFIGVYITYRGLKYKALITHNNKKVHIGYSFKTPEEAAIARDRYIVEHNLPHRLSGLSLD